MKLNEKTDGVAGPVLVSGNDTKLLRVFDEKKPDNILLIGGNADIGIIYPQGLVSFRAPNMLKQFARTMKNKYISILVYFQLHYQLFHDSLSNSM